MVDQIKSKIAEVNTVLLKGEPDNISEDTYSHYTGYKPQAVVDAMNAVFEIGEWGFEEISSDIEPTKDGGVLAVAKVKVWLKGVEFQPTGWGQARVTKGDLGDARKGAQTDAIKKSLSYFSIGNRAYLGLLPGKDIDDKRGNTCRATSQQSTGRATSSASANKTGVKAENKNLENIPSARSLFKDIDDLQIKAKSGNVCNRRDVLAAVFRKDIDDSHGAVTIDSLMELGTELSPEYCQRLNTFLARYRQKPAA